MIRAYELQPGDRTTIYFQGLITMTLEDFINLSLKGLTIIQFASNYIVLEMERLHGKERKKDV